jgi:hypothetical protein
MKAMQYSGKTGKWRQVDPENMNGISFLMGWADDAERGGWKTKEEVVAETFGELAAEMREAAMDDIRISEDIDTDALAQAIEAVLENNRYNGGKWSDWTNAEKVAEIYEIELCDDGLRVIERAIRSDGESLDADIKAVTEATGHNWW